MGYSYATSVSKLRRREGGKPQDNRKIVQDWNRKLIEHKLGKEPLISVHLCLSNRSTKFISNNKVGLIRINMNYNNETSCPTSYLVAFRCAKHYCSCQLQHLLSVRSTYKRIASEPAVRVQSPVNSVLVQRDKVRLGQWFLRVSPDSPCQT